MADGRLDLLDRPPQIALLHLRTVGILEAGDNVDRPLQRSDHLPHRDLGRSACQRVTALRPVRAHDESLLGQPLENLRHQLGRDRELLGDALGAHGAEAVLDGDIMNRHQPVIGTLGEAEHPVFSSSPFEFIVSPIVLIGDYFGRILPPRSRAVNGKGLR